MKKNFYFLLMAALVCGLSLSVTSCKDDDNNNGQSEEQQDQQAMEQQEQDNARFAVLDQLADIDTIKADFLSETFEPGIGMPDGDDTSTRIVNTNDAETAAERFANIVGAIGIDENTTSFPWKDDKMGTMTYTKVTDGTAWATVDVNIKQVPKLQKIIFRAPEQGDNNAAFKGRAYYRFGDVIKKFVYVNSYTSYYEYWLCVRPAFGPEKKEDSHWVCLRPNLNQNVIEHVVGDKRWYIPTKLGTNKEHMQNLAEMLYAILNPEQWENNVLTNIKNKKMKMFGDFNKNNEPYHNKFFWQNVCKGWDKEYYDQNTGENKDIWSLVFRTTKKYMTDEVNNSQNGLHLLYNGYSWASKKNLNLQLWQARYTNGAGVNSNMHTAQYTEPKAKLNGIKFDCRYMGGDLDEYGDFFPINDECMRWCVRHATGLELTDPHYKYSVKKEIPGTYHVYRYYQDVDPNGGKDLSKAPEPDMPL
jgi:hypothetical protein